MRSKHSVLFLMGLGSCLALASSPLAQTQFSELGKHQFPRVKFKGTPHLVDVDQDKDLDVVFADYTKDRLFLNNGEAVFSEAPSTHLPTLPSRGKSRTVVSGDIDGDGDADLFFSANGQNRLYLNDGKGRFSDVTKTQIPQRSGNTQASRFVDIDGDKDLDLILANNDSIKGLQNRIYRNNGKGVFTDISATHAPKILDMTGDLVVGDFDGNGTPDVVFVDAASSGYHRLWLNDGKGKFTDASNQMPAIRFPSFSVDAADIDKDGDLDLVFGSPRARFRFFRNMGKARFVDDTQKVMPTRTAIPMQLKLADIDLDGDMDLLAANQSGPAILYIYDRGRFLDVSIGMPPSFGGFTSMAVGDLDGDKDPDCILNDSWSYIRVYLGIVPGRYVRGRQFKDASWVFPSASGYQDGYGDLNGDGHLDILIPAGRLRLGDGTGHFRDAPKGSVPSIRQESTAMAMGDVNGDGHLDAWIGTRPRGMLPGQDHLFLGDGKGHFSDATFTNFPKTNTYAFSGEFVDLDGDGDLDLASHYWDSGKRQLRFFLNDGKGHFSKGKSMLVGVWWAAPTFADVDGDGDLDMVFGLTSQNQLWLNDGKGNFKNVTATSLPSDKELNGKPLAGDIDGDGDVDLFFPAYSKSRNLLYVNNGKGVFKDVSSRLAPMAAGSRIFSRALVDIDEDGDLDFVWSNFVPHGKKGPTHHIWINDGKGRFKDEATLRMQADADNMSSFRMIDLDGDGDLDYLSDKSIILNRHRQIHAPWIARTGATWAMDYYSEAGVAKTASLALPYFGVRRARLPIPGLGTFGIDPTSMFAGAPILIPSKTGWTRVQGRIPSDTLLIGRKLYIQALIISRLQTPPGIWKLTNVLVEPIYK